MNDNFKYKFQSIYPLLITLANSLDLDSAWNPELRLK